MFSHPTMVRGLHVFVCALTLAASGDDFNLPRVILAPSLPVGGSLPLDDPNTDYICSTNSRDPNHSAGHPGTGPALLLSCPAVGYGPGCTLLAEAGPAATPPTPGAAWNLPLLC
jgi:hypothetical protein